MARIIRIQDKTRKENLRDFIYYFENNLLDIKKTNKEKLDKAYLLLYGGKRSGGSCASCLVNVYHSLESIYHIHKEEYKDKFIKELEDEFKFPQIIVDKEVILEVEILEEVKIEEKPKPKSKAKPKAKNKKKK